jgi:hypothetical protein
VYKGIANQLMVMLKRNLISRSGNLFKLTKRA